MWRFLRHTTRLLRHQGYYIKAYQGYYVTVTLTNHRPFQNRPTLDAKKMHFCSWESRESRIFGISAISGLINQSENYSQLACKTRHGASTINKFWYRSCYIDVILFQLKGLSHVYLLVKMDHPQSSADAAQHITNSLASHPKVSWWPRTLQWPR